MSSTCIGAVNSVLGAFTTTFGTYIIPLIGYNLAFSKMPNAEEAMVKKPLLSLGTTIKLNWLLAFLVGIFGVGFGGYTAMENFIAQIEHFDYFADCYQCEEL